MQFNLRKTGGRRHYFYYELWALVQPTDRILIGHEKSGRFSRGSFLILPKKETLKGFLIAGKSDRRRAEIKTLIESDYEFRQALERLMHKEFCQMTIGPEIHVGGPFLLKRVTVLRYFPLPDDNTEPWKRDLELIASKLRVRPFQNS